MSNPQSNKIAISFTINIPYTTFPNKSKARGKAVKKLQTGRHRTAMKVVTRQLPSYQFVNYKGIYLPYHDDPPF